MWKLKEFESIYSRNELSRFMVRDFYAFDVINEAKFYYWQKNFVSRETQVPTFFHITNSIGARFQNCE